MDISLNQASRELPWKDLLTEFASIPSLIGKISREHRAYETNQILQDPAYLVMEGLLAHLTVVYSPPKVGGQTIAATLWAHPSIPQPKHIHFLSPKGLAFMEWLIEQSSAKPNQHEWRTLLAHSRWVRVLLAANRMLRAGGLEKIVPKPVLIAGVREPMGQYLSMVFQNWWMYVDSPADLNAESIRARMIDDPWRHQCNNWFKDDLGESIGLDVFARPFPIEQGWDIYENDVARVLIIRQENLDRLPVALGMLYGIDPASVKIENRNRGDEKDYSTYYSAVKKDWRPSGRDLEEVYSAPYLRHFYSAREIEAFQERWQTASTSVSQKSSHAPEKKERTFSQTQKPETVSVGPSNHHFTCRPCPQCAKELQSIPGLHKTCEERLDIIERMRSFWPVKLLRKCRSIYKRLFRGVSTTK